MVLGMRAKGALPWMLDFVGNGPMFVPRPTYNPNPSAGLYHSRQVLSFDVTGPHRYLPMIQALKRHKVCSKETWVASLWRWPWGWGIKHTKIC